MKKTPDVDLAFICTSKYVSIHRKLKLRELHLHPFCLKIKNKSNNSKIPKMTMNYYDK